MPPVLYYSKLQELGFQLERKPREYFILISSCCDLVRSDSFCGSDDFKAYLERSICVKLYVA